MNGNTIEETLNSIAPPCGLREFCELHAIATARELAQHYLHFARSRPPHDVVSPDKFGRHFSAIFQHHFRREVAKEEVPPPPMTSPACTFSGVLDYREAGRPVGEASFVFLSPKLEREQPLQNFTTQRPISHIRGAELAENHTPSPHSSVISHIRKTVRQIFKRNPSHDGSVHDGSGDESERIDGASGAAEQSSVTPPPSGHLRLNRLFSLRNHSTKRRQETGSICKEGLFSYLEVNDTISDTTPRWMRCRLLVRRMNDRFELELYTPPKVRLEEFFTFIYLFYNKRMWSKHCWGKRKFVVLSCQDYIQTASLLKMYSVNKAHILALIFIYSAVGWWWSELTSSVFIRGVVARGKSLSIRILGHAPPHQDSLYRNRLQDEEVKLIIIGIGLFWWDDVCVY